jgi:hypothetical protein
MCTSRKVWPTLIAAIALAGCKTPGGHETFTPDPPKKPLACEGPECEVYKVRHYESLPLFLARGSDGKMYERQGFRIVLETRAIELKLTCDQSPLLTPPPACGQGMLLAGETVWGRKGSSGQTLYVYSNETPQRKRTVSLWHIENSEAK